MEMAYTELNAKLCAFLDKTPNSFFAVKNIKEELAAAGFAELQENSRWQLQSGGKYYVSRNGSALLAFVIPKQNYLGFQVYACHCDSPAFKLKNNAEILVDKKYVKLNVEKYGGMLCAPWFDRPLSVAGRLIVKENNRLVTKLINVDRDLVMIPNLAIHMNREVNKGYDYNIQKDMLPLYGCGEAKGKFMKQIAEAANVKEDSVISIIKEKVMEVISENSEQEACPGTTSVGVSSEKPLASSETHPSYRLALRANPLRWATLTPRTGC